MQTMTATLRPLGETFYVTDGDGVRSTSGVHLLGHSREHSTDALVGYRVVITDWRESTPRTETEPARFVLKAMAFEDVEGATNYGRALEIVNDVRSRLGDKQYAVIENVYRCGCSGW